MNPSLRLVITAGLAGGFLLGRGRPQGLQMMETSPEGAWRSFAAALICLPAFLALKLLAWGEIGVPDGGLLRSLVAELTGYVLGWVGFALVSLPIANVWGRTAAWPRFIAAWNWTNVVQYLVLLALTIPGLLGLPEQFQMALTFAALLYAVGLEWYVARLALGVDGMRAAALVAADFLIAIFLSGLVQRLSGG